MIKFLTLVLNSLADVALGVSTMLNDLAVNIAPCPYRRGSLEEKFFRYFSAMEHHPNYFGADALASAMDDLNIPETEENVHLGGKVLDLVAELQGVYAR